jgi:hypothetical protein
MKFVSVLSEPHRACRRMRCERAFFACYRQEYGYADRQTEIEVADCYEIALSQVPRSGRSSGRLKCERKTEQ